MKKVKEEATKRFMMTNQILAMNQDSDGIQRVANGGFKNMKNANSTTSYYFNYGGLKNQVVRKFKAAGFETDPPPTQVIPEDEDIKMRQDYARQMAEIEAQNATYAKRLADEQARVNKVRANVIPAARALDAADDNLSNEAWNAFDRSAMAENPAELKAAIAAYPQELRNVLPKGGNYNIASWDSSTNNWKRGSGPDRELYCTPYGCFTYQKAGATDVPIIGGNYGFVDGVDKGNLPFQKVSDKEAKPGDVAIVYGKAPVSYVEGGDYVIRPHHTTVLSDHNPIVRDSKGNIIGINMYNASNGQRLNYREEYYPKEDHFGFYRYVGQLPKLEKEGASFSKRKQAIEDEYNRRHAAYLEQYPLDGIDIQRKEPSLSSLLPKSSITPMPVQSSDLYRYLEQSKPTEKVRRLRFKS